MRRILERWIGARQIARFKAWLEQVLREAARRRRERRAADAEAMKPFDDDPGA